MEVMAANKLGYKQNIIRDCKVTVKRVNYSGKVFLIKLLVNIIFTETFAVTVFLFGNI
jgi:hypothetical protein